METLRKPKWLRVKIGNYKNSAYVEKTLEEFNLNTVCEEANCPNRAECFSNKTATFMILGRNCSRNCRFCDVTFGNMTEVDENEPKNLAKATKKIGLKHVVVTSVTRDDLDDGGASQFVEVIKEIRKESKGTSIEVLIPDLQGNVDALESIVKERPEIINHNVETIKRLYQDVRPSAIYERSLEVLANVKKIDSTVYTKSGIMVGLGEEKEEIIQVMKDLRKVNCDFLTIGQYLQPSKDHYPVKEYVHPDLFDEYKKIGLELGFVDVASAPLVRSSYNALDMFNKI
ncbi:MAG: lipoyl synthase [Bacillota bacterium]|nr:lipoyl synthase [Bacillota bacterium]